MSRLEIRNVCASYGRTKVLHDVTLPPVQDGQILGLLGPNASGKSTLVRRLSREMPGGGEILLDGADQARMAHPDLLRVLAAMPQSPPAPTVLSPTELMWSTARALALPYANAELGHKIEDIFSELGLTEYAFAPLLTLSGGKRQLVGLALALIRDPQFLLLDEPTSALDLHWRMVVLDLVRQRIKQKGGLAVAALHDLDLALTYCDRLALIDGGRIIATGEPAQVLTAENLARVYHVEAVITESHGGNLRIEVLRPLRHKGGYA